MLSPFPILTTLPALLLILLPHPTLAGTYSCGNEAPNGCGWTQQAWDAVYALRQQACSTDLTANGNADGTISLNNNLAQLQVQVRPGYTNNHCWSVTNNLIHDCFDTAQGRFQGSGTWCADAACNEWYWIWMNPASRDGCWDGARCVAFKESGGC